MRQNASLNATETPMHQDIFSVAGRPRQTLFLHAMHELPECDARLERCVPRRRYVAVGITGENRPRSSASGSSVIAHRRTRSEPRFADDRLLQPDAMATGSI